jgi:hypothetical protein
MEAQFLEALSTLPDEGMRLKKFRKSIFDILLQTQRGDFNEENSKQEFQILLDNLTEKNETIVDNGFIKRTQQYQPPKKNSKKRNYEEIESEEPNGREKKGGKKGKGGSQTTTPQDPMDIAILNLLNELPTEGIRLKKFRQTILDQFAAPATAGAGAGEGGGGGGGGGEGNENLSKLKEQFASSFEKMCAAGNATEMNGMVQYLGERTAYKMKIPLPTVDHDTAKKEMWKYGEQVWQDGSLDQDYLLKNPDGITRLFCGNLKKEITEEQLHNAINGIVYIKWMTDKTTREFYGSTFLEMKNPAAAAAAVLLDKTKLLGRFDHSLSLSLSLSLISVSLCHFSLFLYLSLCVSSLSLSPHLPHCLTDL